jgi:hypothetical protein
MVLGAAMLAKAKLPPVRLVSKPAEERGWGPGDDRGRALDGVEMTFRGHVDRHYPTGQISPRRRGQRLDRQLRIEIQERAARRAPPARRLRRVGSLPGHGVQTIVSREINPAHPRS